MKLRVRFEKTKNAQFLGHLDIMRFFQKVNRRAEIDVKYTTGFSPHQVMSFGNPLGLGQISSGEYMDIELNSLPEDVHSSQDLCKLLNRYMPIDESIHILSCRKLSDDADNAMASVVAASYEIYTRDFVSDELKANSMNLFSNSKLVEEILAKDVLEVEKATKKTKKLVNIKPMIYSYEVKEDSLCLLVSSGSVSNLKPDLVLSALHEQAGIDYEPKLYQIRRVDLFTAKEIKLPENAENSDSHFESMGYEISDFISLGDIGEDF